MTNGFYKCGAVFSSILLITAITHADIIGYWRMEEDLDASAAVTITNEAGYNSLVLANGNLDTSSGCVMTNILADGVTNNASLAGNADINAHVDSYTNLNCDSITVEFFARTAENDAGYFTRATDSDGMTFSTNGISIVDPNAVDIYYATDDGAGGTTNVSWYDIHNSAGTWDHYAFTYDAATGIGAFYINGVLRALDDGPDNHALDWGDGNAAIRAGYSMDGGGALKFMGNFDELRIANTALPAEELLYKPLIARDSFSINAYDFSYFDGDIYPYGSDETRTNRFAIMNTVGFSTNLLWNGSLTGNMSIRYDIDMTHNLLTDEVRGALRCKAKDSRTQYRQLSTTIPDAPVYYMCCLLRAQTTEPNESISLGFSNTANNRTKGINVGFNNGRLAVFAGGNTYDISSNPYNFNVNYLVVLRFTANTSGDDVIDVYLAENGAETIDFKKSITVETFSSTADLGYLKCHIEGHLDDAYQTHSWRFDEIRLATNPAALGIDPSLLVVQPPAGTVFFLM